MMVQLSANNNQMCESFYTTKKTCLKKTVSPPLPLLLSVSHLLSVIHCAQLFSLAMGVNCLRPHGLQPVRLLCLWGFSRQNTGVGFYALLQGIFPTQGLNPGLPHCSQILLPSEPPGKSQHPLALYNSIHRQKSKSLSHVQAIVRIHFSRSQ